MIKKTISQSTNIIDQCVYYIQYIYILPLSIIVEVFTTLLLLYFKNSSAAIEGQTKEQSHVVILLFGLQRLSKLLRIYDIKCRHLLSQFFSHKNSNCMPIHYTNVHISNICPIFFICLDLFFLVLLDFFALFIGKNIQFFLYIFIFQQATFKIISSHFSSPILKIYRSIAIPKLGLKISIVVLYESLCVFYAPNFYDLCVPQQGLG